jgi:hypothetical protein
VELLNNAKLTNDAAAKAAHLKELQELVLRKVGRCRSRQGSVSAIEDEIW